MYGWKKHGIDRWIVSPKSANACVGTGFTLRKKIIIAVGIPGISSLVARVEMMVLHCIETTQQIIIMVTSVATLGCLQGFLSSLARFGGFGVSTVHLDDQDDGGAYATFDQYK